MAQSTKTQVLTEKTFLRKTFLITGVGFGLIFLIGLITNFLIDSSGVLREELNGVGKYDFSIYRSVALQTAAARLARVSFLGIGLLVISSILQIIWLFRIWKASKTFIYITFGAYILAQGIGFGILFVTWNAIDLIAVFAIAGIIFMTMALVGYTTKRDMIQFGRWLIYGSIAALVLIMINFIFYLSGVYSNLLYLVISTLGAVLTIGWIAYEVWSIRKTSEYAASIGGFDEMNNFRISMWMGFLLLTSLVRLIWYTARFYRLFLR